MSVGSGYLASEQGIYISYENCFSMSSIKMFHVFDLITGYTNTLISKICLRIYSYIWLVDQNPYYHLFLGACIRGYPAAWVDMQVVVGSPQRCADRGGWSQA